MEEGFPSTVVGGAEWNSSSVISDRFFTQGLLAEFIKIPILLYKLSIYDNNKNCTLFLKRRSNFFETVNFFRGCLLLYNNKQPTLRVSLVFYLV